MTIITDKSEKYYTLSNKKGFNWLSIEKFLPESEIKPPRFGGSILLDGYVRHCIPSSFKSKTFNSRVKKKQVEDNDELIKDYAKIEKYNEN